MPKQTKPSVLMTDSLDKLDIRVGRIIDVELETRTPRPTYKMEIDFGKFGRRVSYGRFTRHPIEEVRNRLVLGVLNFDGRKMGEVISEVLVLGVQYPKADSGEATFVSPAVQAKVGSKLFGTIYEKKVKFRNALKVRLISFLSHYSESLLTPCFSIKNCHQPFFGI